MHLFKQVQPHIHTLLICLLFILCGVLYTARNTLYLPSIPGINQAAVSKTTSIKSSEDKIIEDYTLNIFCTEKGKTYVKAISGSGVFLTDPDNNDNIILTNAHVARHLLDSKKSCVGRTGSPAATTHKLTLRYIPSHWLGANDTYVIGDPDQSSTGEYDFALIEASRIVKKTKTKTNIYQVFRPKLYIKISDYKPSYYSNTSHFIYSYPAQKTLSLSIYSPLYRKKDKVEIGDIYQSPTLGKNDSLLDAIGSTYVDHGSSGGMMLSIDTTHSLTGLSSILIKDTRPQIVRIVTMRHVFDVLDNELASIRTQQSETYSPLIKEILSQNKVDVSVYSILKNQKLTAILEENTRKTLIDLNIVKN